MKQLSDEPSEELERKFHAMTGDLAKQVQWSVNGNLVYMSKDDWRYFICAHIKPSNRILPKIEADGIVLLGVSSKALNRAGKCLAIELMYSLGANKGVRWADPREQAFMEYYANA